MSAANNSREGDIPPNHGGQILEPHRNDVLSGRGGRINAHPGNVQFRELVKEYRPAYLSDDTKKLDKVKIAAKIVQIIRSMNPPGRFLKEENKKWIEIGDEKARKKAGQAMREKAEDFRKEQQSQHHHQQIEVNAASSPQQILPGYSPNATSPTSPAFVTSNNDPYLQMNNSPFFQRPYPQAAMMGSTMPPLQQMNFGHHPSPAQLGHLSSQNSDSKSSGLMSGNAVAFNREFNRMSSSESGNAAGSINVSSMGSINTSMSSTNRSSLSSRESGRGDPGRSVQIMEPIHDDGKEDSMTHVQTMEPIHDDGKEDSMTSGWDDSWAQDAFATKDSESVISSGSDLRKNMFRNMKNESSCLPSPHLSVTDGVAQFNENELMKESLVSVEMQSMEMRKSVNFENKSMQMASMQMDSISELIVDTLQSDEDNSLSMNSDKRSLMMQGVGDGNLKQVGMVFEKPKNARGTSGISTVSGISVTSDSPSWAAIEQNHSTLPDLPDSGRQMGLSDYGPNANAVSSDTLHSNRNRMFSDHSNKSTAMMSEISMSMGQLNIDLDEDQNDEY